MNKYEKWYEQIVQRAKNRVLNGYYERHHILPRSLGGLDISENIVCLTAREHFICHWLLTKFTVGEERDKMLYALRMMRANKSGQRYTSKITARVYEKLKTEYSEIQRQRILGENNPMYGKKFYRSEEGRIKQSQMVSGDNNGAKKPQSRKKISKSKKGVKRDPFNPEWLEKLAESNRGENNGMYGKNHTDDSKSKMRAKAFGRKQSEETIRKKADAVRGSKRQKKLCPHCNQMISVNTFPRWHGDNCKHKHIS